ncbi:uncharacterized protein LOC128223278 [Mya arenaria]|uniref:uncharacterized protein LOC128223278 n=1 Tax=Mya arenaria TaxID=6604 RepID=UPI0022E06399|nr:uncharacterized protein LOC128223278 [Mya arenaria]
MADARSSLNEKEYFTRVFFALTDCGRRVLLHLLQRRAGELTPKDHKSQPWSLDEFLIHNKAAILLPTGRERRHKDILYPFKQDTDLTKWDIPVFVFVLLKACELNDNGDLHRQLRDDIDNLKSLRNVMVNSATPTLKKEFYHMYFWRIVGAVQRICDYMQEPGLKESLLKELDKYERLTHIDYEDQMNVYDVDICLRGYQQELAKEGCEGENVIVIAPPNSGKTRVACRIMQDKGVQRNRPQVEKANALGFP